MKQLFLHFTFLSVSISLFTRSLLVLIEVDFYKLVYIIFFFCVRLVYEVSFYIFFMLYFHYAKYYVIFMIIYDKKNVCNWCGKFADGSSKS